MKKQSGKRGVEAEEASPRSPDRAQLARNGDHKRVLTAPKTLVDLQSTLLEGEIEQGKLHGLGKMTLKSGEVREGQFHRNSLRGPGKRTLPDGTVMAGHFVDNELNGRGQITDKEGNIWKGEFKNSVLNGPGESKKFVAKRESVAIDFPIFKVRKGTFRDGKLEGEGINFTFIHYKNKHPEQRPPYWVDQLDGLGDELRVVTRELKGQFVGGKLHGQGSLKEKGVTMEGEFVGGVLHGKGEKVTYQPSSKALDDVSRSRNDYYSGRTDWGQQWDPLKRELVRGSFQGVDELNGFPEVTRSGQFENGELVSGVLREKSERREGEFKNDRLHGRGKAHLGSVLLEGIWETNVLTKGKVTVLSDLDFGKDLNNGKDWWPQQLPSQGKYLRNLKPGTVFSGVFINVGMLEGLGSMTVPGLGIYEGHFRFGMMEGQVALTKRSGSREFGVYYRTEDMLKVESRINRAGVHSTVPE